MRDQLSGNSGCGTYTATFTHNGDAWTVQEPKVEPIRCPSGVGQPASAFLGQLPTVTRVELSGTQLRLITPGEMLVFTRQ